MLFSAIPKGVLLDFSGPSWSSRILERGLSGLMMMALG